RANSSTPVGTLNGPKQDVALQASGQMDKAADYRQVVVAWRNGSPVKLEEVARIYDSVENDKIASWLNDERSIVLGIQKQPDANTVAVVDSLLAKLPALRAQVPPPVDIRVLMDRSISIRQAVSDVEQTLLIAVALAGNRLHQHFHYVLADRRVHSGAADGRHRRPRVPRVRGDGIGRDHRFRIRVADADADAVRARAEGARCNQQAERRAFRL